MHEKKPDVLCCICDGTVDHECEAMFTFAERPEWNRRRRSALWNTEAFGNWYFKTPWLWGSFVRCIIDHGTATEGEYDYRPRFELSGVTQIGHWTQPGGLTVPLDTDIVTIGLPPRKNRDDMAHLTIVRSVTKPKHIAKYYKDIHPLGTQIHARCWDLAQRVFGACLEEDEDTMDLFIQAARERVREWRRRRGPCESDRQFYIQSYDYIRRYQKADLQDFRHNPRRYVQEAVDERIERYFGYNFAHDPVNIPELRDFLAGVIREAKRDKSKEKEVSEVDLGVEIPFDIKMMILDILDSTSIRNLLSVFHWRIPDIYWLRRFARDTVYEYEDIKEMDLDLVHLCLGVEDLLKTSHGLRYRRQTLNNLREIKRTVEGKRKKPISEEQ